jgi:hypothetical protein
MNNPVRYGDRYQRRCRLLEFGIVIPAVAGSVAYIHLLHMRTDHIVPALYSKGIDPSACRAHSYVTLRSAALFIVGLAGLTTWIGQCFKARRLGYNDRSDIGISWLFSMFSRVPLCLVSIYVL